MRVFFPSDFAIDNAFLPNEVLNLELMPLLLVENLIVAFNQDSPQGNAPKKMPNPILGFVFLLEAMSKHTIMPVKFMERLLSGTTKLKENLQSPPPNPLSLEAIP